MWPQCWQAGSELTRRANAPRQRQRFTECQKTRQKISEGRRYSYETYIHTHLTSTGFSGENSFFLLSATSNSGWEQEMINTGDKF